QPDGSVKIYETNPATGVTTEIATITNGRDGQDGLDGKSVSAIAQPDGSVKIIQTDPTTGSSVEIATITNGRDGQDGKSVSVKDITTDGAGNTVITLTDGEKDYQMIISKGDKGDSGQDGRDGQDGKSVSLSANPTIDTMYEGDTTITGRGIPSSTIIVTFQDGSSVTTVVNPDGKWTVSTQHSLVRGENIFTTQTEVGKEPSSSVDGTVIWKSSINENGGNTNTGDNTNTGGDTNTGDNTNTG
ncbi:Ig-like domain-containing protein, partial [Streptococcus suis]